MAYQVKLDSFEGPLDLLLYLIRRNNIDIYNIPVAEITAQYLEYIDVMEKLNIEVAGEFLVMSSTLIHIKSEMLLPKPKIEEEEEEDPRDELVKKLLEYEGIKKASKDLGEKEAVQRDIFTRNRITFTEEDYVIDASLFDLLDAFKKIVSKAGESVKEVLQEEIKVEDRIKYILSILEEREWIGFSALFARLNMSRQLIIVSFIALLELIKQKKIYARQSRTFGNIRLYKKQDTVNGEEQDNTSAGKQIEIVNELRVKKSIKDNKTNITGEKADE